MKSEKLDANWTIDKNGCLIIVNESEDSKIKNRGIIEKVVVDEVGSFDFLLQNEKHVILNITNTTSLEGYLDLSAYKNDPVVVQKKIESIIQKRKTSELKKDNRGSDTLEKRKEDEYTTEVKEHREKTRPQSSRIYGQYDNQVKPSKDRFSFGTRLTPEELKAQQEGENALQSLNKVIARVLSVALKLNNADFCTKVEEILNNGKREIQDLILDIKVHSIESSKSKRYSYGWSNRTISPLKKVKSASEVSPKRVKRAVPREKSEKTPKIELFPPKKSPTTVISPSIDNPLTISKNPEWLDAIGTHGQSWAELSLSESPSTSPFQKRISPHGKRMHEKLSAPERRRKTPEEVKMDSSERHAKANWNRGILDHKRQEKLKQHEERIREVNERNKMRTEEQKRAVDDKLRKAQKTKQENIQKKVNTAKAVVTRAKEVLFISNVTAENQKDQKMKKIEETEKACKQRREEILQKVREKGKEQSANYEKVIQKRKMLDEEREKKLEERQEARKEKEERIQEAKIKEIKARIEKAAQHANKVRLVSEIKRQRVEQIQEQLDKKMRESSTRKNENLERIREKAAGELKKVRDATERKMKKSTPQQQQKEESTIQKDDTKQRTKKTRKRLNSLVKKMEDIIQKEDEKPTNARLNRVIQELQTLQQNKRVDAMKTILKDLMRILDTKKSQDLHVLRNEGGIDLLVKICEINSGSIVHDDVMKMGFKVLSFACSTKENSIHLVKTLQILILIELLRDSLMGNFSFLPYLFNTVSNCLKNFELPDQNLEKSMKIELVNYMIKCRLINKLKEKILSSHTPLDLSSSVPNIVLRCLYFLQVITSLPPTLLPVYIPKTDIGVIINGFREFGLIGIPTLLSSILLSNGPPRGNKFPSISPSVLNITLTAFKVLNNLACLDLQFFQKLVGETYHSELYHILSYALSYCCSHSDIIDNTSPSNESRNATPMRKMTSKNESGLVRDLLHELILFFGFFALQNEKNQETVLWGNPPTIFQKLCSLPIQYFTELQYKEVLFPTIVAICYKNQRNKEVLEQEMSTTHIIEFIKEESKKDKNDCKKLSIYSFVNRFPRDLFEKAIEWFENSEQQSNEGSEQQT